MNFPTIAEINQLDAKHPAYLRNERLMTDLQVLYKGGDTMRKNAARFLMKRSKEIGAVYQDRLLKATYENLLASIVVWFNSKLFEQDIQIEFKTDEQSGKKAVAINPYYTALLDNCDNAGTTIQKFFERLCADLLVYGDSYMVIDLPRLTIQPTSLYEQEQAGGLNPYFVYIDPQCVQNWSQDAFGAYEWVILHTATTEQTFLGPLYNVERWTYYDKQNYAVYEMKTEYGKTKSTTANLIASGLHALAEQYEVPLKCISADDRLWLGNRVILPLIEHFQTDNSFGWGLFLANTALPVFSSGKDGTKIDISQTAAEYSAIVLPEGAKFEWVEPEGKSWDASQKRLQSLKDGIYQSCHLLAQAKTSKGSDYQSGLSKEVMMQPATDVLNILGSLIRTAIQNVLVSVAAIRGDGAKPDVRGLNFSDDMSGEIISQVIQLQAVNVVQSDTFLRQMGNKLIRINLRDANADLIQTCIDENEAAPIVKPVAPPAPTQATVAENITERGEVS